jgi:hypothetical protein
MPAGHFFTSVKLPGGNIKISQKRGVLQVDIISENKPVKNYFVRSNIYFKINSSEVFPLVCHFALIDCID